MIWYTSKLQKSNEIYENPTGNLKILGLGPRRKKRHDEIAMAKDNIEGVIHHMIHMVPFIYYVSTFIAQKIISLPNFWQRLFFVKTKEFIFKHYILTKFSWCNWKILMLKKENNCLKKSWKFWGWSKKC